MKLWVNGKPVEVAGPTTLDEVLRHLKVESRYIAVAVNRTSVPRGDYAERKICELDQIEILTPFQGG